MKSSAWPRSPFSLVIGRESPQRTLGEAKLKSRKKARGTNAHHKKHPSIPEQGLMASALNNNPITIERCENQSRSNHDFGIVIGKGTFPLRNRGHNQPALQQKIMLFSAFTFRCDPGKVTAHTGHTPSRLVPRLSPPESRVAALLA